ncbi:MAG: XRE family transcriptional regulator [Candidatus Zixiibacteriota bacterium]
MLSDTLVDGLNRYEIGPKLRALRLKRKIGLVELGEHSGLSPAMISKIERGLLFPTLPTLLRLAMVFSVGLEFFFGDTAPKPVFAIVRKEDRIQFPADSKIRNGVIPYRFESLDYEAVERKLSAYLAHFEEIPAPPGKNNFHEHDGYEFIYLISGRLAIYYDDDNPRELRAGDSVYFDATVPHAYVRQGADACTGVVVTVP